VSALASVTTIVHGVTNSPVSGFFQRSHKPARLNAERWTRLDAAIKMAAELRPDQPGADDPEVRRLAIGRLQSPLGDTAGGGDGPHPRLAGLARRQGLTRLGPAGRRRMTGVTSEGEKHA
jgi:hypothetical protein